MLVVEDEPYMAEAIRDGLRLEAIAADIAGDGDAALELLSINAYDIAVLDRDIPGPSGDEIAESIVASGSGMPILMLTAADRLNDKASGFELGADDYLTKPFSFNELLARLRTLQRRSTSRAQNRLQVGDLILDPESREVSRAGVPIILTRTEYSLLERLMYRAGKVVPRHTLIESVWGFDREIEDNTLDAFVRLLRHKVDREGLPKLILTVRGVGYMIREETVREEPGR